jgi:pre-mRNA-splicing factor RBM22/SLT11
MADQEGWERSDFPIVCETCLGDNPYVRMTKSEFDKECKVCTRPFTVFRWRAGTKGRYKKTEVCQTCAKLKNVCQTCLLDLTFNLPVQVRDSALEKASISDIPLSDANRNFQNKIVDGQIANGLITPFSKTQFNPVIQRLARNTPYYDRNRAHICSFFVKGNCNRGMLCPFRHEKPEEVSALSHQNIKDRYYGVNDPVADKLLTRESIKEPIKPEDTSITTLYIGNVDRRVSEQDLRDQFYHFGEISSLLLVPAQHCAFLEFESRQAAENVFKKHQSSLIINGVYLKLAWAKPQQNDRSAAAGNIENPALLTRSPDYYPSMDSERLGSRTNEIKPTPQQVASISVPLNAPNWTQINPDHLNIKKFNS